MSIYSEIKPEVRMFADMCVENSRIDPELYLKYDVKRGLRDLNGKGVLTGLTNISEIISSKTVDGKSVPCEGELYYRGYSVEELVRRQLAGDHFGYERTAYLLLFGELPDEEHFKTFCELLSFYRTLPTSFVRDIIMKAPSSDMMNTLARSVLTLYSYDEDAEDISIPNVLRQSMQLIALFPLLSVYGYQAYRHYHDGQSLFIHQPDPKLSTAENILRILRPDCSYTELEARVLDIALILHADHGGGNNSTFTTHVVTSSGTDTYSAIAAALGSLKGPKHGGANIKVVKMFEDIKEHVKDWNDDEELTAYLRKLLHKEAFDKAGLIYGMGHAVYSLSDPAAARLWPGLWRGFPKKRAAPTSTSCTPMWSAWPPSSSPRSGKSTRAFPPTWTSTAALSTACWICPWSCTPHSVPHCPHCRLERHPHGGAHRPGQDYPPPPTWRCSPIGRSPRLNKNTNTRFSIKKGRDCRAMRRPFLRPCVKNRQGLLQKFSHPLDYGVTL